MLHSMAPILLLDYQFKHQCSSILVVVKQYVVKELSGWSLVAELHFVMICMDLQVKSDFTPILSECVCSSLIKIFYFTLGCTILE